MPVYEYECKCGKIFEKFMPKIPAVVPETLEIDCECGAKSGTKIFSKSSFHLMPGKVSWGEGRFSSAAPSGDTPVSIDEPS